MIFRHFIWDFDGTLFDSYPHIARALQSALRECGAEETAGQLMPWLKQSVSRAVEHLEQAYGLAAGRLMERYRFHEENDLADRPVQPYPGAREVCREIAARGGKSYLYTHRGPSAVAYLRRFGMEGFFRGTVTSADGFPPKPAPDAIRHIVETFGLDPKRVLMVGDRDIDVRAGTNAGVHACLFDPDGFYAGFPAEFTVGDFGGFAGLFLGSSNAASENMKKGR